jgi:hypothetical protein
MSAPAPALEQKPQRIVMVRLSDPAAAAACLSLAFAAALALFPVSFPRMISDNWFNGHLVLALAVVSCVLNAISYLRVAHILSRKPDLMAAALLGIFTVSIVVGLSAIESGVLASWIAGLPNPQAYTTEEILAHTYFTLMLALFLPFLAVRFIHNFKFRPVKD